MRLPAAAVQPDGSARRTVCDLPGPQAARRVDPSVPGTGARRRGRVWTHRLPHDLQHFESPTQEERDRAHQRCRTQERGGGREMPRRDLLRNFIVVRRADGGTQRRYLRRYLRRAEAALKANPELRRELLTRYPYCIVDEYQDTDLAQHRLLEALYGPTLDRIMVVGDVLQSIYAFRGAHPENMSIIKAT